MPANALVQTRIDPAVKERAAMVLEKLGITISDAVRILLTRTANEGELPFALTGYHPDYDFLRSVGIELSSEQMRPVCDPENLESNVPGIYVAGVIVAGSRTNEIFIENGRFHGKLIAAHISEKLGRGNPNFPLDAT